MNHQTAPSVDWLTTLQSLLSPVCVSQCSGFPQHHFHFVIISNTCTVSHLGSLSVLKKSILSQRSLSLLSSLLHCQSVLSWDCWFFYFFYLSIRILLPLPSSTDTINHGESYPPKKTFDRSEHSSAHSSTAMANKVLLHSFGSFAQQIKDKHYF